MFPSYRNQSVRLQSKIVSIWLKYWLLKGQTHSVFNQFFWSFLKTKKWLFMRVLFSKNLSKALAIFIDLINRAAVSKIPWVVSLSLWILLWRSNVHFPASVISMCMDSYILLCYLVGNWLGLGSKKIGSCKDFILCYGFYS